MPSSSDDDNVRLNADNFVMELYRNKSFTDSFWSGVKLTCIALALMMSTYAVFKCSTLRSLTSSEYEDVNRVKAELLKDEKRETDQFQLITRLNSSLSDFIRKIRDEVSGPDVMFDCYRVNRLTRAVVVTYDGCFVDTTAGAINVDTGFFTVREAGRLPAQLHGQVREQQQGKVRSVVIADSQREYNGNELSSSESSTHTIMVLYPLNVGDLVKVQFNKDGSSYIHSDNDHDVHFTGRRVSSLPRPKAREE
ncbi:unnamed protein product [Sphagnum tenellum]